MAATSISLPSTKFELEFNHGSDYGDEERDACLAVLASKGPSCGAEVLQFEKEFAMYTGSTYALSVGNCTQGLDLAVRACLHFAGGRKDVIVPSISWISTASAAALAGATVRFADVVDPTICVDINSIKGLVTNETAAVVVVHLYGRPVDGIKELSDWLKLRKIYLIEDCAHCPGGYIDTVATKCGTIGDIGVFSFHQQKNMVTLGEGGMCVTNNSQLRERMMGARSLFAMSYDPKGKYLAIDPILHPMHNRYWLMDFADHGYNFRMTDIQAAVGRVQLKKLDRWNQRRTQIAQHLADGLKNIVGLQLPPMDTPGHTWHLFHVLVGSEFPLSKEEFMWALLSEFGIKCWNHYMPMHLSTSFRAQGLGYVGQCKNAESLFEKFVSLPLHPRLTNEAVLHMISAIKNIAARPNSRLQSVSLLSSLLDLSGGTGNAASLVQRQFKESFEPLLLHAVNEGLFHRSKIFISRAPGRLDLMGGNDDYTGGLVFETTIAEATFVAAQCRDDPLVVICNPQQQKEELRIPVEILKRTSTPTEVAAYLKSTFPSSGRWPLYVVGVLYWLCSRHSSEMFHFQKGLSLYIWSSVPPNRGVSSSASVEVAVMKVASHMFNVDINGAALATACQWVENQVCSSACGLMDQMAVTLGTPFMAMKCQPAQLLHAPPLPSELTIYAVDSGVSHEVSGIEYEAARAAAFMGYKIICHLQGIEISEDKSSEIPRFTDSRYNGYLANISRSVFEREFEKALPQSIRGDEFVDKFGSHVDPATPILADHLYDVRANTKYAVFENDRVNLFYTLLRSKPSADRLEDVCVHLGELMYQSHDAYTECGLGCNATSMIVDLVRKLGSKSGLYGAKITGGGAGGTVCILGLKSAESAFDQVVTQYASLRGLAEKPYAFVGSSPGADSFGILKYSL